MKINLIAAMTLNNVIGRKGDMPWNLPADMKHFVKTTKGATVIMGRKTFESIGSKPLPGRFNIVVTRDETLIAKHDGICFADSFGCALAFADLSCSEEVFVIGGGELYKQAILRADKLFITIIDTEINGDTFFPEIDKSIWKEDLRVNRDADDDNEYNLTFIEYTKI